MIKTRYKKFLPALAIALAGSFCGMNAYAETPAQQSGFADENFYKCVASTLGVEEGTVLTAAQLATVTTLKCDDSNKPNEERITSLSGIEHLINLEVFEIRDNNIRTADFSSNTALTNLTAIGVKFEDGINLSGNRNLLSLSLLYTRFNSIDLSNNTSLVYLDLEYNRLNSLDVSNNLLLSTLLLDNDWANGFTSINISHLAQLSRLSIVGSGIASLDVSHNQHLKTLDIQKTNITSIDLSQNPELDTFFAGQSKISSIDVTHNPLLRRLSLKNTDISSLNLANNKALQLVDLAKTSVSSLDIPSSNVITLDVDSTKLTTLNLSNFPELGYLTLDNTDIKSIDISNNPKLHYLSANKTKITRLDVSNNPTLTYLSIDDIYVFSSVTTDDKSKRSFDLSPLLFLVKYEYEGDDSFVWNNPANTIDIVDYDAFAGYIRMTKINPYKLVLFSGKIPKEEQEESDDSKTPEKPVVNPNTMDDAQLIALASAPFFAIAAFGYHKLAKRR